jgi:fructose-specific phosphotransferase system IIC component
MNNWLYTLYFVVIGIVAFVTREIVTFLMLGFVIISLHNINSTLKEILKNMKEKQ